MNQCRSAVPSAADVHVYRVPRSAARPAAAAARTGRIGPMTNPQQSSPAVDPYPVAEAYPAPVTRPGRGLAGAIAVFLGGYLLLAGFSGFLGQTSLSLFADLVGRGGPEYPASIMVLAVLQFVFAMIVVVVGLILAGRSVTGKLIGAILVVAGSILTFVFLGLWLNGVLPLPGGREGIPFRAVFTNTWFAIVLFGGIAWLLARRARVGWIALLGTLILIPVPTALQFAGVESGITQIVMYLLSGIVGAGIILAGRPLRD
jgi:hypothetical protein